MEITCIISKKKKRDIYYPFYPSRLSRIPWLNERVRCVHWILNWKKRTRYLLVSLLVDIFVQKFCPIFTTRWKTETPRFENLVYRECKSIFPVHKSLDLRPSIVTLLCNLLVNCFLYILQAVSIILSSNVHRIIRLLFKFNDGPSTIEDYKYLETISPPKNHE